MRGRLFSSLGLVLSKVNYGEADRILFVLTYHYGRLALLAKGVRRINSRKRGSLEIFNLIRFQASRGKNLDVIREVELVNSFDKIRTSLKKITLAYYFSEVLLKVLPDGEENKKIFDISLSYFEKLENERNLSALRQKFLFDILTSLGFWPKDKELKNFDFILERVLEKKINAKRIGIKVLS